MKYPAQESGQLEFKEALPKSEQILKTVIAFCNHVGGQIMIGIRNDGTVLGLSEKDIQHLMEHLDKHIFESCSPPILPHIYSRRIDDKLVLVVEVSPGMNKPYFKTSEGMSHGVYVRLGRSTMKANAEMIEELKWQSRGIAFDHMPVYRTSMQSVSKKRVEKFLAQRRHGKSATVTEKLLLSYYLIASEHGKIYATNAGILLFSDNPQHYLSEATILCTEFAGISGRDAIASRQCGGSLFEQFEAAFNFIMDRLNVSFSISGKRRQEKIEIPAVAVREALMNAIVHRNYHIAAPIKVAMYNNRIEIVSPGGFPGPMDVHNLEMGVTYMRNTAIGKVMWESRYVEKMGSGLMTIFDSYRKAGLLSPELVEGTNFIKCILPRIKVQKGDVSDNASMILHLIKIRDEIRIADAIKYCHISRATAGRMLSALVSDGKIKRIGKGSSVKYRLS